MTISVLVLMGLPILSLSLVLQRWFQGFKLNLYPVVLQARAHYGKKRTKIQMKSIVRALGWPFIVLIKIYQYVLSPWLGPKCRYTPTCSQYALEAFKKYGLFKGFWLSLKRVSRCHPWGGHGYDPVP